MTELEAILNSSLDHSDPIENSGYTAAAMLPVPMDMLRRAMLDAGSSH